MDEEMRSEKGATPADDSGFYALVEIIRTLPETYRRVLELRYVTEWSVTEIAQELHIKEETVKTRIFRGRKILIEKMAGEGYVCG